MRKANLSRDSTGGFGSRKGQGCCVGWRNIPALLSPSLGSHKPKGMGEDVWQSPKFTALFCHLHTSLCSWEGSHFGHTFPSFSPVLTLVWVTTPNTGLGMDSPLLPAPNDAADRHTPQGDTHCSPRQVLRDPCERRHLLPTLLHPKPHPQLSQSSQMYS